MSRVVFDLTIFDSDGVPWFGTLDIDGAVTESDFQTPDPVLAHDRPYLLAPENWSATEIDFLAGSSRIGAVSVGVLDRRLTATDQTTGIVTSRISEAVGSRAILRRWDPDAEVWRIVWDGVVNSCSVDSGSLLVYWLHLRDEREREREQPLFVSNFVLLGAENPDGRFGAGPAIDYGALPGGGYLLDGVGPAVGTFEYDTVAAEGDLSWGRIQIQANPDLRLLGEPVLNALDGRYYHRDVWVRWRPVGYGDDDWVTLRDMPSEYPTSLFARPGRAMAFSADPTIRIGSFDPADLPADGQEIEFQILAAEVSAETPFFWDSGTFGDLLREIYDGDHSAPDFTPVQYDEAAMAAFAAATPATHFVLTEPVTDMRKWVEANIYLPTFHAPAFGDDLRVAPVSGDVPSDPDSVPVLEAQSITPVGDWQHSAENVVNAVDFTYQREAVKDQETTQKRLNSRTWVFIGRHKRQEIEGTLTQWERYVTTPVVLPQQDDVSVAAFGRKPLELAPVTVRAVGDVDGLPLSGDTSDEVGAQLAQRIARTLLGRFARGAPVYVAEARYSDANVKNIRLGDWRRVRAPWLPSYATGTRDEAYRYMQVLAISDSGPAVRVLTLIDSSIPDLEAGTGEEDCLTGGELVRLPGGRFGRVFTADGDIVNACDHAVTVSVLIIAGGGGGGSGAGGAGGGGGAGGVIALEDVVIGAGETIPVHVGLGGGADANGEDSVIWAAPDGAALDPDTDPEPVLLHAIGGGEGGGPGDDGITGGSGGGAGASYPISGGSSTSGGGGTAGQGSAGGGGQSSGGTSTCQGAGAGGGGSYAGVGGLGSATMTETQSPEGGAGGASEYLPAWGVTAGGGGSGAAGIQQGAGVCVPFFTPGVPGSGTGAGGGGSLGGGTSGIVVVEYAGAGGGGMGATLDPPTISSADVDADTSRVTVCVEDADWPPVAQAGYQVRVDYALGGVEPDAASGEWRTAGYLDAPGCIVTPPVPTGAKVWSRAIAEADEFLPSAPSTAADLDAAETPGLLAYALVIDELGVGTVTWTPNAFAGFLRIRGLIHDGTPSLARPLALIADPDPLDGTYELPGVVGSEEFYTVDLETWESAGPTGAGRIYRLSEQQPASTLDGLALEEGAIPVGGPNGVPTALPPGPEGWITAIVSGVPTWVNPADFLAGIGGPVVRRIMHLVPQATRAGLPGADVRNVYDTTDTPLASSATQATCVYSASLNLQGVRVQVAAGAANRSAVVRGVRHEAPLKSHLNAGSAPLPVLGQLDWYMRLVDDVLFRIVTTGHASDIALFFGMGHIQTFLTVGCVVGFHASRLSTELEAVVWSGVAGVSTFHVQQVLTGVAINEVHRLEVRIGYLADVRYIEWYADGLLVHSWAPPVAVDIVWTVEIPSDSAWSTWWSTYVANTANAAEVWGLLGEGCMVDVVIAADTIA